MPSDCNLLSLDTSLAILTRVLRFEASQRLRPGRSDRPSWAVRCHTRFSVENRMHLICVPGSQFHTYDRLMSVISQDIAKNVQKRFINFYYTHEGRHGGLYTNNDNYEDATPSSSSTGFLLVDRILRTPRSWWSTPLRDSFLNGVSKDEYTYGWYSARPHE
jgi:hypothetical protein